MSENTVAARIRTRAVDPDGVLIQPGNKVDVLLFETERIPQLRNALATRAPAESEIEA